MEVPLKSITSVVELIMIMGAPIYVFVQIEYNLTSYRPYSCRNLCATLIYVVLGNVRVT
jgi:hypothetical protein